MISSKDSSALALASDLMKQGGVFAYPTDTIYGLGGNGLSHTVLDRIYQIKKRSQFMPVSLIMANMDMLERYVTLSNTARHLISAFLPGKLTLIVRADKTAFPRRIYSDGAFIGVRMPDNGFCLELSRICDLPIVTTSVNLHGEAALTNSREIMSAFSSDLDEIFTDDTLDLQQTNSASTIIKIDDHEMVECIREGAVPYSSILNSLAILEK